MSNTNFNSIYFEDILHYYEGSIIICDNAGKLLLCSDGTCKLTGLSREKLLNTTMQQLVDNGVFSNSSCLDCIKQESENMSYLILNGDPEQGIYAYSVPIFDSNHKLIRTITFSQSERFSIQYRNRVDELCRNMQQTFNTVLNSKKKHSYIAESPSVKRAFDYAKKVAQTDASITIYGESGSGKEVLAKYIHENSLRKNEIFVPVNCATIPEALMESEIFGYEKGSFTGANKSGKSGLFELANNGTLFLDEIGEMPINLQPKLLRVLETGEIRKLGGTTTKKINVRIISATNRNLLNMVKEGTFREDLYYRLNIIPITMPALRERVEDIEPLINFFLNIYNYKYHKSVTIDHSYKNAMINYTWPGNVRELKNAIQRYVITDGMSQDLLVGPSFTPSQEKTINSETEHILNDYIYEAPNVFRHFKDYKYNCEYQYFFKLLKHTNGNVAKIAALSGLHMSGIYKRLDTFKLDPKKFQK